MQSEYGIHCWRKGLQSSKTIISLLITRISDGVDEDGEAQLGRISSRALSVLMVLMSWCWSKTMISAAKAAQGGEGESVGPRITAIIHHLKADKEACLEGCSKIICYAMLRDVAPVTCEVQQIFWLVYPDFRNAARGKTSYCILSAFLL